MRDIMFDIPSNPNIEKCIVTRETVEEKKAPKLIINENKETSKKQEKPQRKNTNKKIETA